ncbi:MAG: pimeloyl-ACP methyl ester carboxylesterase [Myxococcota bacterium]|jgi:pimeloyl-ACP methyl ester carboxylesterase
MPTPAAPIRDLLLVTGAPFSATLWSGVEERLRTHGLRGESIELLDCSTVQAAADLLASRVRMHDGPLAIVAHGSAVPAALRAAAAAAPAALVLTNGPAARVDPILKGIAALPTIALSQLLLRPGVWLRWLASSAGLRRAVINPYVMDRDMVVTICQPPVNTAPRRAASASWLKDVARGEPTPSFSGALLLVWGDHDPLYPASDVDIVRKRMPQLAHTSIPGGQHLHPIERPWAIADAIAEWLSATSP